MEKEQQIQKAEQENLEIAKPKENAIEIAKRDEYSNRLLNKQLSLFRTAFPTKSDREIMEYQAQLLKQKANANLENHRMFYEFQRQSIKDTLDAVLIEGKGFVRARTANVFSLQLSELEDTLRALSDEHDAKMDMAFDKLEKIKNASVRERKERWLIDLNDNFMDDLDKILTRYRQVLNELV